MLHSNRLGQGLPITTIILAVLGLIVLVIVAVMVSQKASMFGKGTGDIAKQECSSPNTVQQIGTTCEIIFGKDVGNSRKTKLWKIKKQTICSEDTTSYFTNLIRKNWIALRKNLKN